MLPDVRFSRILVLLVLFGLSTGCTQLGKNRPSSWVPIGKGKPVTPTTIVANWTDSVSQQGNGRPIRGFGGRLMFYGPKRDKPVKVDGSLVVFAFDEQDANSEQIEPTRKFVFTEEQLATHYSESKLGHSYSIWIPWEEMGGPRRQISLVPRFTSVDGFKIVGEYTRLNLPGQPTLAKADKSTAKVDSDPVRQVSHYEPISGDQAANDADGDTQKKPMAVTTIPIPKRLGGNTPVAARSESSRATSAEQSARSSAHKTPTNSKDANSTRGSLEKTSTAPSALRRGPQRREPPSTGFQRAGPLVPVGPIGRQARDPAPSGPSPEESPSPSQTTPPGTTPQAG